MRPSTSTEPPADGGEFSRYKGVRKRKWGKWVSEIRLPNSRERIWLGSYDSPEKAARAFDVALYCLRGSNVKFNFPENPPCFEGAQNLTPQEIQTIANRFANESGWSSSSEGVVDTRVSQTDTTSVSSDVNATRGDHGTMDWSFLNILDDNVGVGMGAGAGLGAGGASGFGLYDGFDSYLAGVQSPLPPHGGSGFMSNDDYNNDDNDNNYCSQHSSFLWNF